MLKSSIFSKLTPAQCGSSVSSHHAEICWPNSTHCGWQKCLCLPKMRENEQTLLTQL